MIIDYKEAKMKHDLQQIIKRLRKIYNDINIFNYYLPEAVGFKFIKGPYIREMMIPYIELESFNIEELLKFNLNNFCYEVYEKREEEIKR